MSDSKSGGRTRRDSRRSPLENQFYICRQQLMMSIQRVNDEIKEEKPRHKFFRLRKPFQSAEMVGVLDPADQQEWENIEQEMRREAGNEQNANYASLNDRLSSFLQKIEQDYQTLFWPDDAWQPDASLGDAAPAYKGHDYFKRKFTTDLAAAKEQTDANIQKLTSLEAEFNKHYVEYKRLYLIHYAETCREAILKSFNVNAALAKVEIVRKEIDNFLYPRLKERKGRAHTDFNDVFILRSRYDCLRKYRELNNLIKYLHSRLNEIKEETEKKVFSLHVNGFAMAMTHHITLHYNHFRDQSNVRNRLKTAAVCLATVFAVAALIATPFSLSIASLFFYGTFIAYWPYLDTIYEFFLKLRYGRTPNKTEVFIFVAAILLIPLPVLVPYILHAVPILQVGLEYYHLYLGKAIAVGLNLIYAYLYFKQFKEIRPYVPPVIRGQGFEKSETTEFHRHAREKSGHPLELTPSATPEVKEVKAIVRERRDSLSPSPPGTVMFPPALTPKEELELKTGKNKKNLIQKGKT